MNITYRQLAQAILAQPAERLDDNVTVLVGDEFFPINELCVSTNETDVLDEGHLFLMVKEIG